MVPLITKHATPRFFSTVTTEGHSTGKPDSNSGLNFDAVNFRVSFRVTIGAALESTFTTNFTATLNPALTTLRVSSRMDWRLNFWFNFGVLPRLTSKVKSEVKSQVKSQICTNNYIHHLHNYFPNFFADWTEHLCEWSLEVSSELPCHFFLIQIQQLPLVDLSFHPSFLSLQKLLQDTSQELNLKVHRKVALWITRFFTSEFVIPSTSFPESVFPHFKMPVSLPEVSLKM